MTETSVVTASKKAVWLVYAMPMPIDPSARYTVWAVADSKEAADAVIATDTANGSMGPGGYAFRMQTWTVKQVPKPTGRAASRQTGPVQTKKK